MTGTMPPSRPHLDSLWWTPEPVEFPRLAGDLETDLLIVGGGITGLTLAWTMAEAGAAAMLSEAGALAGAASGRNAGFLFATPPEPYRERIALWGRDGARAALQIGRRSHQRVRQLVESLGIDCDYRSRGGLRLAVTPEEAEDQRASLADLHADGFRLLETPVRAAVPGYAAEHFAAAFALAEDGELHPVRFLHGLARAAIAQGVPLYEATPLEAATWDAGAWSARTPRGTIRARTLVLATNAFTPRLCPMLDPLIAPRRGQMLATAPLDREIIPQPTSAHWGYRYWRQLPDRRLIIGGWRDLDLDGEVGFDDRPTPPIQAGIEEGLKVLVPEGAPIEHRWAGTMGFARDGRPLVGWLDAEHHLAICAGFTGHGMAMAPACTQDLAELLAWRPAPGIATFDPARFPELRQAREPLTALGVATG